MLYVLKLKFRKHGCNKIAVRAFRTNSHVHTLYQSQYFNHIYHPSKTRIFIKPICYTYDSFFYECQP